MSARAWSPRRIAVVLATSALALTVPLASRGDLRAQLPPGTQIPGMPDLSSAPADVQAIWKKVTTGGRPTPAEATRLADWMTANKDKIVAATTKGLAASTQAMGGLPLGGHAGQPACPTKVALPATLAIDPTATAAAALLDSLKVSYAARLTPAGTKVVQRLVASVTDPAQLSVAAGTLLMKDAVASAVLVYIAEVSHASGAGQQSAWGDLGAALIAADDWQRAVRVLRRAIWSGARTAPYVTDLGVAYADLGDLATATTLLTEATRLSPNWSQAWDALGRVQSCAGNMIAAAKATDQAQEDDWSASRQDEIDQRDQKQANADPASDDAAAEAAKPIPMPPGRSPFPAPPAGGSPGYFAAWAPKLGDTWQKQSSAQVYQAQMGTAFRQLSGQILAERDKPSVTTLPGAGARAGMFVVFMIGNGAEATRAAQLVSDRASARMTMMVNAWQFSDSVALAAGLAAARPLDATFGSCERSTPYVYQDAKCLKPWCDGMTGVAADVFAKRRAAAGTLIGGEEGLSGTYSKAMNAWFDWAGEPDARREIDRVRRAKLASMEAMAYDVATQAQAGPPDQCAHLPEALARLAKAEADAARETGTCNKVSIHIPYFASMDADCHTMTMSADILSDFIGDIGTPTFEIQRATSTKNGKFFIGLTKDWSTSAGVGDASAAVGAGLQVTWDNAGWVQSSGGVLRGSAGMTESSPGIDASANVSGDLLINGSNTGPALTGSASGGASASVPALGYAPSVSFGGK